MRDEVLYWGCLGITTVPLLVASLQDVRTKTISIWLPLLTALPGIALVACGFLTLSWLGTLILCGALLLFSGLARNQIGFGDTLLLMALLPCCGVNGVILVISCTATLAAIHFVGTMVVAVRGRKIQRELPFVPFIAGGFLLRVVLMIARR